MLVVNVTLLETEMYKKHSDVSFCAQQDTLSGNETPLSSRLYSLLTSYSRVQFCIQPIIRCRCQLHLRIPRARPFQPRRYIRHNARHPKPGVSSPGAAHAFLGPVLFTKIHSVLSHALSANTSRTRRSLYSKTGASLLHLFFSG